MLREALVDLPWLLVRVDVERQPVLVRIPAELGQRLGRAGPDGVGGDTDPHAARPQCLQVVEVLRDRRLPEPWAPAAQITGVEADEGDSRLRRGFGGRLGLRPAQVVELTHRGVAVASELSVDLEVLAADLLDREGFRQGDHLPAPGPEVTAARAAAQ